MATIALVLALLLCVLAAIAIRQLAPAAGAPRWARAPLPGGTSSPARRYPDVVREFGSPSVLDPSPGGVAIWDAEALAETPTGRQYSRVELRDEQVPHGSHADFLYAWMRIPVPRDRVAGVRGLSDSVTYDPLKGLVRARCHFMGANVGTLVLAKRVATGETSPSAAKAAYGPTIQRASSPQGYAALVRELQEYSAALHLSS